jgi:hypothetical protein
MVGKKKKEKEDPEYWMQELTEEMEEKGTAGSLHRMVGVPESYNMGEMMTLLDKIRVTPIGEKIKNPLAHGKPIIPITRLLKLRAVSAQNRIKASRGLYKKKARK